MKKCKAILIIIFFIFSIGYTEAQSILSGSGYSNEDYQKVSQVFQNRVAENTHYPTKMKVMGVMGTVKIKVVIGGNGELLESLLISSSGNRQLDEAALNAIKASVPFYHGLEGDFSVIIAMRFMLK